MKWSTGSLLVLVLIAVAAALLSAAPTQAAGATFTVTKTADTNDGVCDSDCSLREAIVAANASPDANTIVIPAGVYSLTIPGANEDAGATGDLDVGGDVTIAGDPIGTTIVDGGLLDRIFDVHSGTVSISNMTLIHGAAPSDRGGAILNRGGTVALSYVVASFNSADFGGAIANNSRLTVEHAMVNDGNATYTGGGLDNYGSATFSDALSRTTRRPAGAARSRTRAADS
jgi:CSLREA domain-containing protein